MKATYLNAAGAIALTFGIAACIPQAERPAPAPTPVATPAPTPTPAPTSSPVVQQPSYENYLDAPQTAGTWRYFGGSSSYDGSRAVFVDAQDAPLFVLTCDTRTRELTLARESRMYGPAVMRVLTETATRDLSGTASPVQSGLTKGMEVWEKLRSPLTVRLNARDPLLDAMAITKGRFAVEIAGEQTLYLPAWAEVSRVIEDCR